MSDKNKVLQCDSVRFFSEFDEGQFFDWIKKIECISDCYGKGASIFLTIQFGSLDDDSLREVLALFYRYKVDMKQLAGFETAANKSWFVNPNSYWYSQVFSS